jgi:thioredoxin 1
MRYPTTTKTAKATIATIKPVLDMLCSSAAFLPSTSCINNTKPAVRCADWRSPRDVACYVLSNELKQYDRMMQRYLFLALAFALATPSVIRASEPIYDTKADAASDVLVAIRQAQRQHQNVVLVFGANWCGDCHALDRQMHHAELASLIEKYYVVVKVDVGEINKNLDLGARYHVPLKKGIPAIAILDPQGKLLYAQAQGQFADARRMDYEAFKAFFEEWKPKG